MPEPHLVRLVLIYRCVQLVVLKLELPVLLCLVSFLLDQLADSNLKLGVAVLTFSYLSALLVYCLLEVTQATFDSFVFADRTGQIKV